MRGKELDRRILQGANLKVIVVFRDAREKKLHAGKGVGQECSCEGTTISKLCEKLEEKAERSNETGLTANIASVNHRNAQDLQRVNILREKAFQQISMVRVGETQGKTSAKSPRNETKQGPMHIDP